MFEDLLFSCELFIAKQLRASSNLFWIEFPCCARCGVGLSWDELLLEGCDLISTDGVFFREHCDVVGPFGDGLLLKRRGFILLNCGDRDPLRDLVDTFLPRTLFFRFGSNFGGVGSLLFRGSGVRSVCFCFFATCDKSASKSRF